MRSMVVPAFLFLGLLTQAVPFNFKKFFKKAGEATLLAGVIRKAAPSLNSFINGLLLNNGVSTKNTTKVVPLFSFGDRSAIGGAQVSGDEAQVDKVHAVFQLEDNFERGRFRVKALVPTTSSTKLDRVYGVGVTAVIDYHVR